MFEKRKYKTMLLVILFSCMYSPAPSQKVFRSLLFDSTTKHAIPFAAIKVLHKPFGTFTNEVGAFEVEAALTDSLLITSIGFQPLKIPGLPADTIFLEPSIRELTPVIVGKRQIIATEILGITAKSSFVWAPSGAGEEFAQKIMLNTSNTEYCQIKKVMLSVKRFSNETPALLHVYTVHPISGLPDRELLTKNYLIRAQDHRKGKIMIDLGAEDLYIDDASVFISFEWLGYSKNSKQIVSTALYMTNGIAEPFTYSRTFAYPSYQWFQAHKNNGQTSNTIFTVEVDRLK